MIPSIIEEYFFTKMHSFEDAERIIVNLQCKEAASRHVPAVAALSEYEQWTAKAERFDLPVILFAHLPEDIQTQTFININYYQNRIKTALLCDLTTLTKDLRNKLTWPSLIGRELNDKSGSPLRDKIRVSELHIGRTINLSSLVKYGLLETLLGRKERPPSYSGKTNETHARSFDKYVRDNRALLPW